MAEYIAALLPGGETFGAGAGETVLAAALRQQIPIAYVCQNGTCRTCLFQVVEGEVEQLEPELCMISAAELADGRRLLCMSVMKSDCVLQRPVRRRSAEKTAAISGGGS